MKMSIQPFLMFEGQAEEALNFTAPAGAPEWIPDRRGWSMLC